MGRHTPRRRTIGWSLAAVIGIVALVAGLVAVLRPDAVRPAGAVSCTGTSTLHVQTSSSFSPVLAKLAPKLTQGQDCPLRLDVKVVDGRAALDQVSQDGTDVWIPDDTAWVMKAGDDVFATRGQAGAKTVVATSPIFMVTDKATAARVNAAGGSWAGLSALLAGGSGVSLAVRDPSSSGDGMVAAGSLGEAVWLQSGMDSATVRSVAIQRVTRTVTGTAPALPNRPGEVGLVPEYALLKSLGTAADKPVVLGGTDRAAILRFTWLPTTAAAADPRRRAALQRLFALINSPDGDRAVAAAGLRRPDAGPPRGAPADLLPRRLVRPFDVIPPHHVDHVFAAWYPEERRADLLLVVDVSGSMADPAPGTRTSLIGLVGRGCLSVGAQLPADSRLGIWEFGSLLDKPRDYRVVLPMATLTSEHRRALSAAAGGLAAEKTGTGLYDTMLAAYRSAVASYRPGSPNQVLVFTDGKNEDRPGSITLAQLTAGLRAAVDPRRPVFLTVTALGSKPDASVLAAAVKPVNGHFERVTSAEEIAAVFVHAAVGGLR